MVKIAARRASPVDAASGGFDTGDANA